MQIAIDHLLGHRARIHIMLGHGDMALDIGIPIAILRCLHQQLPPLSRLSSWVAVRVTLPLTTVSGLSTLPTRSQIW